MRLKFHGTRGSIPTPGPDTLIYGGNTTCVELDIDGQPPVIIDAGTGLRLLGEELARSPQGEAVLLMTHVHWDHTIGFPFFAPIYMPGWHLRLGGWPGGLMGLTSLFGSSDGMGRFPVQYRDLPASLVQDETLSAPEMRLGSVAVRTAPLNHPQGAIGLRFEAPGGAMMFITDHELDQSSELGMEHTLAFCDGAKIIIHDAQYLPEEMEAHRGFGHSDWRMVVDLAKRAGAEHLVLTHHDPRRSDAEVEKIVEQARLEAGSSLRIDAAREGMQLEI